MLNQVSNVKVSVCVITYNHEKYIEECLESLVSQKTSFEYEIVIRDDLSQDGTPEILEKYKKKYPDLIRVLPALENVGGSKNSMIVFSAARGDYISWCEGDDFFVSEDKLEVQFSALERNLDANICIHPVVLVNGNHRKKGFYKGDYERIMLCQDVLNVSGQFAASSSYFFRRRVLGLLPSWFQNSPIGDLFLELYSMDKSSCVYTPLVLSAYRVFSNGSWRDELRKGLFEKKIVQYKNIIKFLELSKKDLHSELDFRCKIDEVKYSLIMLLLRGGKYKELSVELSSNYRLSSLKNGKKVFLLAIKFFPRFCNVFCSFRFGVKGFLERNIGK